MKLNELQSRISYSKREGMKRRKREKFSNIGENLGRIVVYTAITGDYDNLDTPSYRSQNLDYVCFTNNRAITSDFWTVKYVESSVLNNIGLARKIKIFPNKYLKSYDTSIWVDAKYHIKRDLIEYIKEYSTGSDILCFHHFERNNVHDEAAACVMLKRGEPNLIHAQVKKYASEGFPDNLGLFETGCIVRKHHSTRVIKLMEAWWNQLNKFSSRDQISFPYVCWKENLIPDVCDLYIANNRWLEYLGHNQKSKKDSSSDSGKLELAYYFPYHLFAKGERVIIYGTYGEEIIGKQFMLQVSKYGYVNIVAFLCDNLIEGNELYLQSDRLSSEEYDSILIASCNINIAKNIKKKLVKMGIKESCIKWDGTRYKKDDFWLHYLDKIYTTGQYVTIKR